MSAILLFLSVVFRFFMPDTNNQAELFGEPTPNSKEKKVSKLPYNKRCESHVANLVDQCKNMGPHRVVGADGLIHRTCGQRAHLDGKFGFVECDASDPERQPGRITSAWLGENQEEEEEYCSYCGVFGHNPENCTEQPVEDEFTRALVDKAMSDLDDVAYADVLCAIGMPPEWMEDGHNYSINFARYNADMSLSVVGKKRITKPFDEKDAHITAQGFMVCGVRFNLAHTKSVPSSVFVRNLGDNSLVVYKIIIGLDKKRNKTIDLVDVTSAYEAAKARGAVRWVK